MSRIVLLPGGFATLVVLLGLATLTACTGPEGPTRPGLNPDTGPPVARSRPPQVSAPFPIDALEALGECQVLVRGEARAAVLDLETGTLDDLPHGATQWEADGSRWAVVDRHRQRVTSSLNGTVAAWDLTGWRPREVRLADDGILIRCEWAIGRIDEAGWSLVFDQREDAAFPDPQSLFPPASPPITPPSLEFEVGRIESPEGIPELAETRGLPPRSIAPPEPRIAPPSGRRLARFLERHPALPSAGTLWSVVAERYETEGNLRAALDALEQAVAHPSDDPERDAPAHVALITALRQRGDARAALREIARLDSRLPPGSPARFDVRFLEAELHLRLLDDPEAATRLSRSLSQACSEHPHAPHPVCDQARMLWGLSLERLRRPDDAISVYRAIVKDESVLADSARRRLAQLGG